jgi:tetratricopeptide (TPR) repeat protein
MGKLRFLVEAMFTCAKLLTGSLALWLIALAAPPGARSEDWPDRIRALAAAGKLADAMQVVEQWKAAEPGDFEARTWHARVEAWQGHTREAEQEFRLLLEDEPGEPDLLIGLAGVLNAQKQYAKALQAGVGKLKACPTIAGNRVASCEARFSLPCADFFTSPGTLRVGNDPARIGLPPS